MDTQAPATPTPVDSVAGSIDLLADRARSFAIASRSEATLSAYAGDWRAFVAWTDGRNLQALPATPETVAMFAADLAATFKPSTISRRLASISVAHQHAGFESPTRHGSVRSVMTGIRRTLGTAPAQVAPATIGEIRKMCARMTDSVIDQRDRAILLLGFASAARRSELTALNVGDIEATGDGLVLTVRRSKRDQEGMGETKAVPFGADPETCPVRALRAWLATANITEGAIFRPIDRHGNVGTNRLSGAAVALVVKRSAERADLDPTAYAGHSLRAGFVTTAAANGATERAIARQTNHTPGSTVLRTYIRHASAFTDNAVSLVGL